MSFFSRISSPLFAISSTLIMGFATPSFSCEWVLQYGAQDLIDKETFYSTNNAYRKSVCSEYTKTSKDGTSVELEGHYGKIGGQGKYSRDKYDNLGTWACENSASTESTELLKKSFVRSASPKVYESLQICLRLTQQKWDFKTTRVLGGKKLIVSLKDLIANQRTAEFRLKVTAIAFESEHLTCDVGSLAPAIDGKKVLTINQNLESLICKRNIKNSSLPGEVLAPETSLIILTSKENITVELGEIANKPKTPKKIVGFVVDYKTKYKSHSGTQSIPLRNGKVSIYNQPGGCDNAPDIAYCYTDAGGFLYGYIKDSCSGGNTSGPVSRVGQTASAADYGFDISCTIKELVFE